MSEMSRAAAVEIENKFYKYKDHGHHPAQYPKVVCWELPSKGRKVRINETVKKYKFIADMGEYHIHVYVLKLMDGIKVMSRKDMNAKGIEF